MKIETIYFLERVNKGNYEHCELSATAKVEDGEDAKTAMLALKTLVNAALVGKVADMQATVTPVTASKDAALAAMAMVAGPKDNWFVDKLGERRFHTLKEVKEEKPKQTRTRKAKEEVVPAPVVEAVVEEVKEAPKAKKSKIAPYGADNKAVLQSYLTQKYGEAWKTCKSRDEIIAFTSKLPGRDFLDEEGNIVESFIKHISSFFGE